MLDSLAQHEDTLHRPVPAFDADALRARAHSFVRRCYAELDREWVVESRLAQLDHEIAETGTYTHTVEELKHGARMAWRNSNRCIGRLFWQSLDVFDERDLSSPEEIHEACCRHIDHARNGGDIRPAVTVFRPDGPDTERVRIWNQQLIRYAGYETDEGVRGDPSERAFTSYCRSRGWEGGGGRFDPLPHAIQVGDADPELFELPDELFHEIHLEHPTYDWFGELGLRWYDLPLLSNMRLEIGGISYTAAPFNGWYMATEIGARNLADEERYDMLPEVGKRLGYDTQQNDSLWKDEALIALNRAVLHSFEEAGVRIVDHHTAGEQFAQFERNEKAVDRDVTGDRSWLVPPMSSAATHTFEQSYDTEVKTPNFFYQPQVPLDS